MAPLRIFCFLLLVWSAAASPLKAAPPPRPRTPVYFPIDASEFQKFGIRVPSGAAKSLSRARADLPPSTTPKPTTTTMRLPIAQESHVAPPAVVTSSPLAYLTDSSYYIPGRTTESPGSSLGHQLLSGSPIFDDDDLANRYIAVHGSAELRQAEQDLRNKNTEDEVAPEEQHQEVLSQDSSLEDQERYGLFFVGEEESFGGSEEHFEQVSYPDSFIPPLEDYRESEDSGAVLQSLPEARPSSRYFDAVASVDEPEPLYRTPSRSSSRYEAPELASPAPSYAPPSTPRSYRPPPTETSASTTERTYRQPATERSYRPPTSERSYRPPSAPERTYRPATESSYRPSTTTERSYAPPTTTERIYVPPTTTEKRTYRLESIGKRTRRPSSSGRIYTPPTTERLYQAPTTERTYQAPTTERSYQAPTTERTYQAPTTERSYQAPTTERSYQAPTTERSYQAATTERTYRTTERKYRPPARPRAYQPQTTTERSYRPPPAVEQPRYRTTTEEPSYQPPSTTERSYRISQQSIEKKEKKTVPSRTYTPVRNRYTRPTTTQRPYTQARRTTARKYTPLSTTTQKPYGAIVAAPSTTERSYGKAKLVSVRKYTGAPPLKTSTAKPYSKTRAPAKLRGAGRTRTRYGAASRVSKTPQSSETRKSNHALYFKPKSREQSEESGFGSKISDSDEENSGNSYSRARQPAIQPTYSAPRNLTVKSVSVASSTSVSKQRSKPSRSRSSSTYKFPFKNSAPETKKSVPLKAKTLASRAGSKYEPPVYRTSTKAFLAPSALYQGDGAGTADSASPLQQNFIQAADNIYVPEEYDESAIPGEAGRDYPVYSKVPDTDFQCEAQQHAGLYADTSAQCQVFHICQESGRHDSFLCPNGTVFNQQYFVCDWWYNFQCDSAASFFGLNEFIYELPEDHYGTS